MKRGLGLLLIATILWGGNYICGRFLGPSMPSTLLNTVRWAISTLILVGILSLNGKGLPLLKEWKKFSLLGFTGIFAFSTLNYLALQSISASQAGMISAGVPIAILLFTPFVLKEKNKQKSLDLRHYLNHWSFHPISRKKCRGHGRLSSRQHRNGISMSGMGSLYRTRQKIQQGNRPANANSRRSLLWYDFQCDQLYRNGRYRHDTNNNACNLKYFVC